MNWETLLCLGDSITIATRSYLGYPEYCGEHLQRSTKKDWNIINCAVNGYTTIDLVRHLDINWSALKEVQPEVISIMIGTNDLKIGTSFENFKIAFTQLLLKSKLLVGSSNIIVNTVPLLQPGVMLPYNLKMNELAKRYNDHIISIAKTQNLMLNEMSEASEFFFDGVHLNENGSKEWGKQLATLILNLRNGQK